MAKLASVPASTLRYWETEFTALAPIKTKTGQRLYSKKDAELVLQIKQLLHVEKLTIQGARRKIQSMKKRGGTLKGGTSTPADILSVINEVRADLLSISNSLSVPGDPNNGA